MPDVLPSWTTQDLAAALVRIPGLSGQEGAVAAFVADQMHALGFDDVTTDSCGNVIGVRYGHAAGPTLLFDGHMDVVPVVAGTPGQEEVPEVWAHDPFGGEIAEGRLWGRGAADTKGALAAMLLAAARLPRREFTGKLVVVASVCEENLTGAALGRVLDRCPADVVVTGEPTSLRLGVAQKGRVTLRLCATGRSAHTSRPELGDNAVYKMIEAIQRLRGLPLPADPDLGPGILELTEIVSEPLPNQTSVPAGCRARFVGRTLPGETEEAVLGRVWAALAGAPAGLSVEVERLRQACYTGEVLEARDFLPGWRSRPDDPWRPRILAALAAAGLPTGLYHAPCGTNASESAGRRGIPSFIYGPGSLAQAHIADEWVSVDELAAAERGYAAIARACLGKAEGDAFPAHAVSAG